jgi:ATP-dependent DNA helicase RecG
MTTLETLNYWLTTQENEHLDFKEAKEQYDFTKLLRYCVAFANERGGYLILGVSDKTPREVVSTNAFLNVGDTKSKILNKLHFRVEIYELQHPGGRVLVFEIPSRSIGHPQHLDGAYLMRSGEELVPMTQDQLKRIFAEGQSDFLNHDATGAISADEVITLLDVQKYFDLVKSPLPPTRDAILDRLVGEKFIRFKSGNYFIGNLGAILLAKDLRKFESVSRKIVRIIKYENNNKIKTEREHVVVKGYAVGFEDLIDYLNNQLPMNEIIGKALREEVRMYPELVIREIVANALIHQDLDLTGSSVMIEIYSDRIEITNPGQPLIPAERFVDEYCSRNENLADVMRRMGICERKGSGIDKVVFSTELYQLPAHDVRVKPSHTTVVLFAYKEFKLMDITDRLRACYLHCCLKYVSNERMTNQSLRERFKLEDTRAKTGIVSQIIAAAVEKGDVKPDDPSNSSKRYAKYIPKWA